VALSKSWKLALLSRLVSDRLDLARVTRWIRLLVCEFIENRPGPKDAVLR
jgi:hypothetical protein